MTEPTHLTAPGADCTSSTSMSLVNKPAVAATTSPGTIDSAKSGRFLYVETGTVGTVDEFRVESDGSLTPIGSATDLPPGIEGIAAA